MTNPPTKPDIELERLLLELCQEVSDEVLCKSDKPWKESIRETAHIIQTLIATKVNEARVDELQNTVQAQGSFSPDSGYSRTNFHVVPVGEVLDRISELTKQGKPNE